MIEGYELNPAEEFIDNIRRQVKDNGGYCIYLDKNSKANKCPKPCKNNEDRCMCGMYIRKYEGDPQ